jgi:hypothetical protein
VEFDHSSSDGSGVFVGPMAEETEVAGSVVGRGDHGFELEGYADSPRTRPRASTLVADSVVVPIACGLS